jgi:YNFM family putative membrane transporter
VTAPSGTASRTPRPASASPDVYLERGSRSYWRASVALLFAGYATFSLLYCVQPLLPAFARAFAISPAQSSLALSLTTAALSLAIFVAGFVSDSLSRRLLMTASLTLSALFTLGVAFAPQWHQILVLRTLAGLALGGVPAVAMAYLAEEVHPDGLGLAMGLYIGGSAIGGLGGRVVTGVLTDLLGWRFAIGATGVLGIASTLAFGALLPPSRRFTPRRGIDFRQRCASLGRQLTGRPELPVLFAIGFMLMGSFVTLFNYIGFRLLAPPYGLSQSAIGAIFVVYLIGVFASPWSGRIADAFGRGRVLVASFGVMLAGIALTLLSPLVGIAAGIVCMTAGFFAGHSVASSWVGRLANDGKAQAAALYLLAYYLGSSIVGSFGGHVWSARGWPGVASLVATLLAGGLAASAWLRRRERAGIA